MHYLTFHNFGEQQASNVIDKLLECVYVGARIEGFISFQTEDHDKEKLKKIKEDSGDETEESASLERKDFVVRVPDNFGITIYYNFVCQKSPGFILLCCREPKVDMTFKLDILRKRHKTEKKYKANMLETDFNHYRKEAQKFKKTDGFSIGGLGGAIGGFFSKISGSKPNSSSDKDDKRRHKRIHRHRRRHRKRASGSSFSESDISDSISGEDGDVGDSSDSERSYEKNRNRKQNKLKTYEKKTEKKSSGSGKGKGIVGRKDEKKVLIKKGDSGTE